MELLYLFNDIVSNDSMDALNLMKTIINITGHN